jgi:hypothetical protein
LTGAEVTEWLNLNGFDRAGFRAQAAFLLKVRARDVIAAAHLARSESDRYSARAVLATGKPLNRVPKLWVAGSKEPFELIHDRRGVEVKELFREDRIFAADGNKSIEASLELLAHLDGSSPAAAVAGGWGAIEGLLAPSNDRSVAADNLAALVTCSLPRAELTSLAHRVQNQLPGKYPDLEAAESNRQRSQIIAKMIINNEMPELGGPTDQAAVIRMKKLLKKPREELKGIRQSIAEAFHRLYRQRNIILHGGKLDGVALERGLNTIPKLAGAGMDRVTHGHYVQNLAPLELVAKANFALDLLNEDNPLACVELLEKLE